jgi:hypothetical protein
MFKNEKLQEHLETSSSINSQPAVIAEWNMSVAENIATIGNYRYRPNADPAGDDGVFLLINDQYDPNDATNDVKFYTDATYADTVVDGGLDDNDQPIAFVSDNEKERLLYSLEDCFNRFRPRSGINKLRYFENNFTHHTNRDMAKRPRYYMPSREDAFKYWTSYRKENGIERGIATELFGVDQYYIHDAAPFVVYKEPIPVNKIVVKMQTHVGEVNLGPFQNGSEEIEDPFFGESNKKTPARWKIQYLNENNWVDAISFDESSVREDNSPVIGSDGYVEVSYGLIIPEQYREGFYFVDSYISASLLPDNPISGSAYLVGASGDSLGTFYIWTGSQYETFLPNYGWSLSKETLDGKTHLVNTLTNPEQYPNSLSGQRDYREIQYIRGIRIVVETMDTQNSSFDLIEISPRLAANLTDKVQSFSVDKSASDLGVSGMPVGQLLSSVGSLEIFDYDQSFNKKNTNSIISKYLEVNLQVKFYEIINFVEDQDFYEYYVPIKTMYADSFPEISSSTRKTTVSLRDLFFYFESTTAPQIFIENASLSYAISLLLDSIGFSNYSFLRVDEEDDPIIQYFFVAPDQSVATILQQLAVSTQSAMFFDEYNNFIVTTKNYIMPTEEQRPTDLVLKGSKDQIKSGQLENDSSSTKLSNIIEMSSSENKIFNDGSINYTSRYIQKTYGSLKQASIIDRDKTWIYKPVLLWEVSGEEIARSREESIETSSSYTLSAIPLNSDILATPPSVVNGEVVNNIIDLGEGVYWLGRYNGYFYANGEIIKFDAVEYSVSGVGNVWVSSVREYQNYFAQIGFNGKLYPTGRVKIYAEPNYEEIGGITVLSNGEVAKHGRGQFGTPIVFHPAGLDEYWSDNTAAASVNGVEMDSKYLFSETLETDLSGIYNEGSNKGRVFAEIEDPEKIFAITYANSQWVGAGNSGKFRLSDNGLDWETLVDSDIANSVVFNSIALGKDGSNNDLWIAAGTKQIGEDSSEAFMASSPDYTDWSVVSSGFASDTINEVRYLNNKWIAVGKVSEVRVSEDGASWTTKTPNFDLNPKTITAISRASTVNLSSISNGTPAEFTLNGHGLRHNDKIELLTTGTLPTGLNTSTTYYVQFVSANSFYVATSPDGATVSTTSAGSGTHSFRLLGAVITASNHGMQDNNVFHIIPDGSLPSGIEEKKIYFARKIDNNRFYFSAEQNGILVDFINSQSGVSHTLNRFGETNLQTAAFGDGKWLVAGTNGQISITEDLDNWTAVSSGFSLTSINSVVYANNLWVAVGNAGKIRTSTNATSWTGRTSNFGSTNINSVAFGNNLWVAAGDAGRLSTSPDGLSWTARTTKFASNIFEVAYGNRWVIVGDRLQVQSSTNGSTWVDQSHDNAGPVIFETELSHNLEPFDYVQFKTNGALPSDEPKEKQVLNLINQGDPTEDNPDPSFGIEWATFIRIGHGLSTGDTIKLFTTGTLPAPLSTEKVYYVTVVDSNGFNVSESDGGPLVEVTGSSWSYDPNGVIDSYSEFYVGGVQPNRRYYVTPAKLDNYQFTVAETIEDARNGNILTAGGSQSGEHSLILDTVEDILLIESFDNNPGEVLTISTESNHNLEVGDRVFFEMHIGSFYSDNNLPAGLAKYAEYYVNSVLSGISFTVSETRQGNAFLANGYAGQIDSENRAYIAKNVTNGVLGSTIYAPSLSDIRSGSLVEITSGNGELLADTRVSATRPASRISFNIDSFTFDSEYTIFNSSNHQLFTGDDVSLSTTGSFPTGINPSLIYYVEKISNNSFALRISPDGDYVIAIDSGQSGSHSVSKTLGSSDKIIISKEVQELLLKNDEMFFSENTVIGSTPTEVYFENSILVTDEPAVVNSGKAGQSDENFELARSSSRNGIIKNFLAKTSFSESDVNKFYSTQAGTIQSSALVMTGPSFRTEIEADQDKNPLNFVSYVYKELDNKFTHFGTRMRIIGRMSAEDRLQTAFNSINYYQALTENPSDPLSFSGSSGGIACMINPETNMGYYFEIVALSESNVEDYSVDGVYNILFYKLTRRASSEGNEQVNDSSKAIPVRLFAGATSISVDDGTLVGQFRMTNESNPSVYDLAVEYEDIDNNTRRFYLYINNRVVGVVDDTNPLPVYNNMALFVRGEARVMFENIYAIGNNYSQNTVALLDTPINSVFGKNNINVSESFRKYSMSGLVQATYLAGIGTNEPPKYNIYFDEFGTIMREASYFNVRYDKAYPALHAQISPTFNNIKGYTVSGFVPHAYGAEFLVFNHTDTAISLDETSGNYLRIQGVTFTQQSNNELTVDDYFENISNFSTPEYKEDGTIISPVRAKQEYQDIKNSRITNGKFDFTLEAPYIQSQSEANDLMSWIISKVSKPRKALGLSVFGLPTMQLGDIVEVDYVDNEGVNQITLGDSRFVVYKIDYRRDASGPKTSVYLSEVF